MTSPNVEVPAQPARQRPRIVVGVDGSRSSAAALAWAMRQATLTGAVVEAVIAWEFPAAYGLGPLLQVDYAAIAATAVADAITEAGSGAEVQPRVVEGHPARVLIDASEGADLLVVGNRGHGEFLEALLGSVSQHCVRHARCPVVVIRPTTPAAGGSPGGHERRG